MPIFLDSLSDRFSEEELSTAPSKKEWSAVQILAHLRAGTEVWSYSIYAMIMLDSPTLAFIHPRDWDKKMKYKKLTYAENLLAYKVNRINLLRILKGLSFADWGRTATFVGKANIQTIFNKVHTMASHDRDHRQQLETMFPE